MCDLVFSCRNKFHIFFTVLRVVDGVVVVCFPIFSPCVGLQQCYLRNIKGLSAVCAFGGGFPLGRPGGQPPRSIKLKMQVSVSQSRPGGSCSRASTAVLATDTPRAFLSVSVCLSVCLSVSLSIYVFRALSVAIPIVRRRVRIVVLREKKRSLESLGQAGGVTLAGRSFHVDSPSMLFWVAAGSGSISTPTVMFKSSHGRVPGQELTFMDRPFRGPKKVK